jgi:hypothetical protein
MLVIDRICDWFGERSRLWMATSLFVLVAILVLQNLFSILTGAGFHIRQTADLFLIPLLVLFVLGTFWRGAVQTFLSLAGAINVYAGVFYVYAVASPFGTLPPIITNKLGVGKIVASSSASSLANFYFLVGMLALVFCLVISLKPSLFRARGTNGSTSYPVWTGEKDIESVFGSKSIILIPVRGLLSYGERHLVARYKYIVVRIGGKFYFVSPDEWIPESSGVVRDAESGSLLGIPKIPDSFNAS